MITMPNIASLHPQVIHFVVALLILGVLARVVSLIPLPRKFGFVSPMAAVLIFLGTAASVVAVKSGLEAHEAVESIPGVRPTVNLHEDEGETTRDIFLVVSLVEIGALSLAARKPGISRGLWVVSAVIGVVGIGYLYKTAEHGGEIVYAYSGGPGLRSRDTTDVRRLLVSGLYANALLDRETGDSASAAARIEELRHLVPNDTSVRLLYIQSLVRDRKDARRALAALDSITVPVTSRRYLMQAGTLKAEAYELAGQRDSARAVLTALKTQIPQAAARLDALLQKLK
jgi:uncharacterized membrane protein